ncbi:hypothetical protein KP003_16645 [Geomonas nitrogeniifigens]|uniref:hypothetical protein n=1 Tax=Geomonas diazotrophica TaxID=2843197 RepID=UPI001C2C37E0|nr:hypothetical protein [Geomonas nitrogeniifigens]QXE85970.1 hypothetical protein KP003_16645 [Geomonas nitrogeniifigens]
MVLDKASILAAQDLKREVVDVPEWGEGAQVIVGEMSALQRMEYSAAAEAEENKNKPWVALALVFMLINEDGERVFSVEDVDFLAKKKQAVLERLFSVGSRLNIVGAALGEEVKNSEASQEG